MARRDIEFNAEGVILRGWFYAAEASPAPAVVMAHGFSAVKEMYLDSFAEVFDPGGLFGFYAARPSSSRIRWLVRCRSSGVPVQNASSRSRLSAQAMYRWSRRVFGRPR
jgi:hypothetical protein